MSRYIKYVIRNIEPVRIADDSSSQNGETVTLRYIPGTTIRGYIINQLSKNKSNQSQQGAFENIKRQLFSLDTKYLNAYLTIDEKVLLPSPKGFYEDKTETAGKKKIENVVVNGEVSGGYKRASLGRYCYIRNNCIYYYGVDTSSDLKIKINLNEGEKQNVFRNEYITAGHTFTGYIFVKDETLGNMIKEALKGTISIGNARSAGFGKCEILECDYLNENEIPYSEYMPEQNQENRCYMMLLSNMAMRNETGEICGMDMKALEELMGVSELKMTYCSTSTVTVRGYNRMWGVKIPSVVMYEQGSVFHLSYKGEFKVEKMKELVDQGIGIRRNEGFGRVLFLSDYEAVQYKKSANLTCEMNKNHVLLTEEDTHVLGIAARGYYNNVIRKKIEEYIVKNPLNRKMLSNSQLGTIESLINVYKYSPEHGLKEIEKYLEHAGNKQEKQNIQKEKKNITEFGEFVLNILKGDLEKFLNLKYKKINGWKVTDVLSRDELLKMKFMLVQSLIRYEYKKGEE